MKIFVVILFLVSNSILINAQNSFFNQLKPDAYILAQGQLFQGKLAVERYISKFGDDYTYKRAFTIQVNNYIDYEIGEINVETKTFGVVFVRSKTSDKKQIELLVIYEKEETKQDMSAINMARDNWMQLCNSHQVSNLVSDLYHTNAYYYNRGRLLTGSKEISNEYGYMNSPNYSLKLTPKQVTFVSDAIAYEIGRCSGSYPLPYLIVWQKHSDDTWKILLDSNF